MASDFFVKQGNRLPILQSQLADNFGYVNISGASAQFIYRQKPTGTVNIRTASIISGGIDGTVIYPWSSGDLDIPAVYWGQWQITYSDGRIQSFPNGEYITFEVIKDLAS